jgi:uncharacterized lipoprotein YmbA
MKTRVLVLLALLAGCASPNPELYTLAPVAGPVLSVPALSSGRPTIELRRIGLAAYLDRPGIVRSNAPYRLKVTDDQRWGEPLGSMLGRVFIEDLMQRLPDAMIFSEAGAISTPASTILEIDVERFDTDANGQAVLLAQVAIRHDDTHAAAAARTIRLTATPAGSSTAQLAAALSGLLGQLANEVGQLLVNP